MVKKTTWYDLSLIFLRYFLHSNHSKLLFYRHKADRLTSFIHLAVEPVTPQIFAGLMHDDSIKEQQ